MSEESSLGDWEVIEAYDKDLVKSNKNAGKRPDVWEVDKPQEEKLEPANNIIKDVIDGLDRDIQNAEGMNSIDFNTELQVMEIASMTTLQMLSSLGLGGDEASVLAQRIQRNKVSINRKGRTEKVDIIKGEREHESAGSEGSLFGKIKGFMGGKGKNGTKE